ncbi:ABC transporter permease [Mycoplasmopsis gallopavonis]|uniref:Glutathione transport system permease protein gsiD n=1 Tax=Mycoplasmopsis gallopavonis TaxID=76629 RepID=A0A449B0C6_9BACT|nr:ABC transporter permease [Mycoplasmopsis gallopavonis]RIV16553.1 ABC transporter permease [Mycoplasmopsis gallopavonis]VEU73220.1 Glutathione transport system permease protein gsiD [Mycoplasmopsis gallopavonis]
MTTKEFNEKYGLKIKNSSPELFQRVPNSQKNFVNIAGKPKKLPIEIAKRFFKNPSTVFFTIIFLVVLLTSIFVTLYSKYDSNNSISKSIYYKIPQWDPVTNQFLRDEHGNLITKSILGTPKTINLPPSYNVWVKKEVFFSTQTEYSEFLREIKEQYYGGYIFNQIIKPVGVQGSAIKIVPITIIDASGVTREAKEVYIDSYKFYEAYNVLTLLSNSKVPFSTSQDQTALIVREIQNLNPQNPNLQPWSILGTNNVGVDIWTSSWIGTWNAIRLALIVATIQTIIGVAVGSYLGFHAGSLVDTIIMRLIEIFEAPPSLIWLLLFASTFGTSDLTLILALVFTGWTGSVGGTRLFIITVKDSEFITASKSVGASKLRLIYRHALPAIIGKIANSYVARIPGIILSVSSLAFLGFFKGDNANLGALLSSAVSQAGNNFWILLLPSLILLSISVSLHFMAIGIHDALDPRVIKVK